VQEGIATVRLCKGAYQEPASIAFPRKADVDANMVKRMRPHAWRRSTARARTWRWHARRQMIEATKKFHLHEHGIPKDASSSRCCMASAATCTNNWPLRYDASVRADGAEWYPYLCCLAERPANVWFVLSTSLGQPSCVEAGAWKVHPMPEQTTYRGMAGMLTRVSAERSRGCRRRGVARGAHRFGRLDGARRLAHVVGAEPSMAAIVRGRSPEAATSRVPTLIWILESPPGGKKRAGKSPADLIAEMETNRAAALKCWLIRPELRSTCRCATRLMAT
jgi:hypothetical protein